MTNKATDYAVIREDTMGAAKMLQTHEKALRVLFARNPKRAQKIREMATNLFDAIDYAYQDATSGQE